MKNKYVNIITFSALVCILVLQGMWLYNTYKVLNTEFKKNISTQIFLSIEKELQLRDEDPEYKKWKEENNINGRILKGVSPFNDPYTNHRYFEDYFYTYKDDKIRKPFSLEKVDSIFIEEIKKDYMHLYYSLLLTDSLNNQIVFINHGKNNFNERLAYKETIQLRNISPEYLTLSVSSPYTIIFEEMALMLIMSFLLAIIVVYGLILQVRMINRQNTIAEMRQNFTHSMIHNMKNPISSIIMCIEAIKSRKIDDNSNMKENFYTIINQEGERILKISNKILEIAKFENEQSALSRQQINLSGLLEKLKEKYLIDTRKKVSFVIELNGVENIFADSYFINEAFDDLIDNAIKYSKEGEDVDIYITSFNKEHDTQIIFKDNGIGISEKDQKIIFNKFERSLSAIKSQNKTTGFGLGLNYVFQVINAHKGTIRVNSQLGEYTEFIINLPYNHEDNKTVTD